MNCQSFQNELFEYVEGTLSTDEQAAADKHLASCDACRQAVEKEKRLARALSSRLQRSSESLALRPEIRRKILTAAREKAASPTMAKSIIRVWNHWLGLAAVPVSLLVVAALLLVLHAYSTRRPPLSTTITPHDTIPISVSVQNPQPAVSVKLSYHLPTQQFHQEGNLVVDALVDETVVASGTYHSSGKESVYPQLAMKTPL